MKTTALILTVILSGCTVWQPAGEYGEYRMPVSELKRGGWVKQPDGAWVRPSGIQNPDPIVHQ